ncbi:hypothetical protein J7K50_04350 [bacterium]|nr:hypothetical protein [bacterium]
MRSLFLMTMCLSIVFLLSCGGGKESAVVLGSGGYGWQTGDLEIMVCCHYPGEDVAGRFAGVDVAVWKTTSELFKSGETWSGGKCLFEDLPVGNYLVTIRGVIDDGYFIRDFPNDEWFPVTIRENETTYFSYTVECREK